MNNTKEILKTKTEFKNYRELCSVLGWTVSAGNSKKKQLEDLKLLCKYEKLGNKIIIKEVYEEKREKEVKLKKSKVPYTFNIENIILGSLFIQEHPNRAVMGKSVLLRAVGLTNDNYSTANEYPFKYAQLMNVNINSVLEFFKVNNKSIQNDLDRALKRLEKEGYIFLNTTKILCRYTLDVENAEYNFETYFDERGVKKRNSKASVSCKRVFTVATDEEQEIILKANMITLEEMGLTDMRDLMVRGDKDTYYEHLYKNIRKDIKDFEFMFSAYDITFNKEVVKKALSNRGYNCWNLNSAFENINKVNEGCMSKIIKNSEKRQQKALKDKEENEAFKKYLYRTKETYLKDVSTITESVIKNTAPRKKEDILNVIVTPEQFLGFKTELLESK